MLPFILGPMRVAVWAEHLPVDQLQQHHLVPDHRCLADRESDPIMRGIRPLDWTPARYRDNTFADQTVRQEFEATALSETQCRNWIPVLNAIVPWDDQPAPDAPVTDRMAEARGYLPRESAHPKVWRNLEHLYRDDDTWHQLADGQVVVVSQRPGDNEWYVLLARLEPYDITTPKGVLRYQRDTGFAVRQARKGTRPRQVLVPDERLWRSYPSLEEAQDEAWRWFREMADKGEGGGREIATDPEVIFRVLDRDEDGNAVREVHRRRTWNLDGPEQDTAEPEE